MMFIPGFLISLVTFPGVIVHEIAHLVFCRLARMAVFEVCYFRLGNPAGYVIHEHPRSAYHSILISIGPFIVNSALGALIAFPAMVPTMIGATSFFDVILLWLGVSIAMHAFPSTGDAKSMWQSVFSGDAPFLAKLMTLPIAIVIFLGALGSFFWLDAIYGVCIAMLLPYLLVNAIA